MEMRQDRDNRIHFRLDIVVISPSQYMHDISWGAAR